MAQTPPFSVRLPPDLQARMDALTAAGAKRNTIVIAALRKHFEMGKPEKAPKPVRANGVPAKEPMRFAKADFGSRLKGTPKASKWR